MYYNLLKQLDNKKRAEKKTAASVLDPARADAYSLQGLADSPPFPDNTAAAVLAFQKAAALDQTDVVSAYC